MATLFNLIRQFRFANSSEAQLTADQLVPLSKEQLERFKGGFDVEVEVEPAEETIDEIEIELVDAPIGGEVVDETVEAE